jgi:insertion element IS1 protein InsB
LVVVRGGGSERSSGGRCFGRRTQATFRRLLALLTQAGWAVAHRCWGAYAACLPAEQHQLGKAPMQRLERKHLTLRTRLKRLTRRTICFSKKQFFHDGIISFFIFHFFF